MFQSTNRHPALIRGIPWPMFRMEVYRLATFATYPLAATKSPALLAAEGFVYVGNGEDDVVVCYFCGKGKKNWNSGDVIEDVHRLLSPGCPRVISNARQVEMSVRQVAANTASLDVTDGGSNYTLTNSEIRHLGSNLQDFTEQPNTLPTNLNSYSENGMAGEPIASPTSLELLAANENETLLARNQQSQVQSMAGPVENQEPITTHQNDIFVSASSTNSNNLVLPDSVNAQLSSSNELTRDLASSNTTAGHTGNTQLTARNPTYLELGIITDRPKRPEYALKIKRLETFALWPRFHYLSAEELAEAGFYYADRGDSTRCFYCGGGLRNWEDGDEVWVEHARWFPRCSYLRQKMGSEFVDIVQDLHLRNEQISFAELKQRLETQSGSSFTETEEPPMKRDPAVKAVLSLGYSEFDILQAVQLIKQEYNHIAADSIINNLKESGKKSMSATIGSFSDIAENIQVDLDEIRQLTERNNQLRQQIICKICLDSDVSVVFLPCGHLVSCGDCSSAMGDCPVCRCHVRGIARAVIY